jgi:hypothetical protein
MERWLVGEGGGRVAGFCRDGAHLMGRWISAMGRGVFCVGVFCGIFFVRVFFPGRRWFVSASFVSASFVWRLFCQRWSEVCISSRLWALVSASCLHGVQPLGILFLF